MNDNAAGGKSKRPKGGGRGLPVPQTPEAVILTKTLSPVSSGAAPVLFLGEPFCWPLNTVTVVMMGKYGEAVEMVLKTVEVA